MRIWGRSGVLFPIIYFPTLLALGGCSVAPSLPGVPTPTPQMSGDVAATAIAGLPTEPPAPAAAPFPAHGRLLIASTRPSPRPHSNLPIDFRLVLWSNAFQPLSLPGDQAGVTDAAAAPDGSQLVAILGQTRVERADFKTGTATDVLAQLG